jgi:hypothetical protein
MRGYRGLITEVPELLDSSAQKGGPRGKPKGRK